MLNSKARELIPKVLSLLQEGPRQPFWMQLALNLNESYNLWDALDELDKCGKIRLNGDSYELVPNLAPNGNKE